MILHLHGFRSSPQSFEARLIGKRLQMLGSGSDHALSDFADYVDDVLAFCGVAGDGR